MGKSVHLKSSLQESFNKVITQYVEWFSKNMPEYYLKHTPEEEKKRHLEAIIAGRVSNSGSVQITSLDKNSVTFILFNDSIGLLTNLLKQLDSEFESAQIHSSKDHSTIIDTFYLREDRNTSLSPNLQQHIKKLLIEICPIEEVIQRFINGLPAKYFEVSPYERIARHFSLYLRLREKEDYTIYFDSNIYSSESRLMMGARGVMVNKFVEKITTVLMKHRVNIERAYLDTILDEEDKFVIFTLYINDEKGKKIASDSKVYEKIKKDLEFVIAADDEALGLYLENKDYTLGETVLLRSVEEFVHDVLSKENSALYTSNFIRQTIRKYSEITKDFFSRFYKSFSPNQKNEKLNFDYNSSKERILDKYEQRIIDTMFLFLKNLYKTNFFVPEKRGLAFRLNPLFMDKTRYSVIPYGVFYVFGDGYRGYQIRFSDIARGGMRIVIPKSREEYEHFSDFLLDEVYELSYAQQLKNKDIPEGGAKWVILLKDKKYHASAVKGAAHSLLSLISERFSDWLKSYYDREPEYIFVGPDENMTPELINWIYLCARRQGYRFWRAFISSKPGAGISHKEYGVTSEGVNVYVEEGLKEIGIDPHRQSFTVKMTGGPDGDVAGNEIKILIREYGENVKIIAIADGYGAIYDPEGLDHKELLRLVKLGLPIVNFNKDLLKSPILSIKKEKSIDEVLKENKSFLIKAEDSYGKYIRDNLCFRVYTDLFIPAGGRPRTINEENWTNFLIDGKPSCRLIVEGANIFLSENARKNIEKKGCLVIKDSSANKCGVICSSYEILANLIMDEKEFLEIKEEFVSEVIEILKRLARFEAKCILKERKRHLNLLTSEISIELSKEVIEATEIIQEYINRDLERYINQHRDLIYSYCPEIFIRKFKERILKMVPKQHLSSIIARHIATRIIYNEGLGWLRNFDKESIPLIAQTYIEKLKYTERLIEELTKSDIKNKTLLIEIVKNNAPRELTIKEVER